MCLDIKEKKRGKKKKVFYTFILLNYKVIPQKVSKLSHGITIIFWIWKESKK